MNVPFVDLKAQYRSIKTEIDQAIQGILDRTEFVNGPTVARFEQGFAALHGAKHAVACGNGTQALHLVLWSLGIGAGDEVILPSHTFFATAEAVNLAGATPVFAEVDERTYTLDPARLDALVTPRTKAVIAVHLYGQAADLDAILPIARARGLFVLEDCSQAHGATLGNRKVGTIGDAAAFSLYPTKNLAAFGDGGVISTDDIALADRIAALRQYGWKERYISDLRGVNSRLDEMQAAILCVRLKTLDAENARRQAIAARYDQALAGTRIAPPARRANAGHVFHQYVVRAQDRPAVQQALRTQGIATAIHYPMPVHLQPAYRDRIAMGPAACRETEKAAQSVLSLPMFPQLTDAQVQATCAALRNL